MDAHILRLSAGAIATAMLLFGGRPALADPSPYCREPELDLTVHKAAEGKLTIEALESLAKRFDPGSTAPAPDCDRRVGFCVALKTALTYVDQSYDALERDDIAVATALLQKGKEHASPWQLTFTAGEIVVRSGQKGSDARRYTEAAQDLQDALENLVQPPICMDFGEIRPTRDEIQKITKFAREMLILSPDFVIVVNKCGDCAPIFRRTINGADVSPAVLPIALSGSGELDEKGRKAEAAFLAMLRADGIGEITLLGHAAARGTEAEDLKLTSDRLSAIKASLVAGGYAGIIHLDPLGHGQPWIASGFVDFNAEEKARLDDRLEFSTP